MAFPEWRRVVVKFGTQVVVDDSGHFARDRIAGLLEDLINGTNDRIIVTSGAVGLGRSQLFNDQKELPLTKMQAAAAAGQSRLMNEYNNLLKSKGVCVAQLLVTSDDLTDRQKYLNFSATLNELLAANALPIVNENDSISTAELRATKSDGARQKGFGDNDKLSAIVAAKLGADLLIILSNVDGFYRSNPKVDRDAERFGVIDISKLNEINLDGADAKKLSNHGRGGVRTKIEAAKIAAMNGVHTIVADGFQPGILKQILSMKEWDENAPCTLVLPRLKLPARKTWIGFSANTSGDVVINAGAAEALLKNGASLLPVGIVRVAGRFAAHSIVRIVTENDDEIGRGLVAFSSHELTLLMTKKRATKEVTKAATKEVTKAAIHKDNLVIYHDKK